jgi:4-amino-4-deoxy-L-arabinose transferase-like glycosyltransferase
MSFEGVSEAKANTGVPSTGSGQALRSAQDDESLGRWGGWRLRSVGWIVAVWGVLQLGGLFSPGLLDDVDSVYIEIAREMLHRHDYVTPYIDGIRFFDKPPLMYWMAAGSMRVFGEYDWAARLPLALAVLGLLLAVYGLGRRLYSERGGFYAALVLATSVGPYLYTRFFIPDILICLWMTLGVWCFVVGLQGARIHVSEARPFAKLRAVYGAPGLVMWASLLTKGLIGLVFPIGFCFFYLLLTRQWRLLGRMKIWAAALAFVVVALPWHVLIWLRNPAIEMPPGVGLPARAGWAWFYLYNEHVARFLGKRIPHDYGNTPVWLFLLYTVIWVMPWAAFLPAGVGLLRRWAGHLVEVTVRQREAALTVAIWAGIVLVFFSISSRQEYYSLPALPALALMIGGVLGLQEEKAAGWVLRCHKWGLVPLTVLIAGVCGWFAVMAPRPQPGMDLSALLASNPSMYNVSLGHLFDLTGAAMGLFRGPLAVVAVGMVVLGPASYLVRRRGLSYAANLVLASGMVCVLMAAHEGLVRFNPILGSKGLAEAIVRAQEQDPRGGDLIVIDGELTSGSTLLFYTRQPVDLVNGRVNGPWFGSFWPDAPDVFLNDAGLKRVWDSGRRVFLLTYHAGMREQELGGRVLAEAGGKTVLINR